MALAECVWNVNTGNRVSLSTQQFVDCDSSRSECSEDLMDWIALFPERLQGGQRLPPGVPQLADQTCIEQAVSVQHHGESITRKIRLGGNEHRVSAGLKRVTECRRKPSFALLQGSPWTARGGKGSM